MTDPSVTSRLPCWCFSRGNNNGLYTKLYKFGWNTFTDNARMNNSSDLNLGEVVYFLKASAVECRSITLIDTRSTIHRHLGRQSVESRLIFDRVIEAGLHSADYQPTLDQALIECRPSIDRDVHRVLIDDRPRMPLVHMIWEDIILFLNVIRR